MIPPGGPIKRIAPDHKGRAQRGDAAKHSFTKYFVIEIQPRTMPEESPTRTGLTQT